MLKFGGAFRYRKAPYFFVSFQMLKFGGAFWYQKALHFDLVVKYWNQLDACGFDFVNFSIVVVTRNSVSFFILHFAHFTLAYPTNCRCRLLRFELQR